MGRTVGEKKVMGYIISSRRPY